MRRSEFRRPGELAGTHTPRRTLVKKEDNDQRLYQLPLVGMGPEPCFAPRDDDDNNSQLRQNGATGKSVRIARNRVKS